MVTRPDYDSERKSDGPAPFNVWAKWVSDTVASCTIHLSPKDFRDSLARAFRIRDQPAPSESYVVIVFGSVARLDSFRDLDLIIIDADREDANHEYQRLAAREFNLDLNIVGSEWLKNAWKDIEWGLWLAESYLLFSTHEYLDFAWRRAANLYWSVANIKQRGHQHSRLVQLLSDAARQARGSGRPLLARLLAHEAGRALVCALIDRHGDRTFSHRSLRVEFEAAMKRLGSTSNLPPNLPLVLRWSERDDNTDYLQIRQALSQFLRDTGYSLFPDIANDLPRHDRFAALAKFSRNHKGAFFERCLESASGDCWLPRESGFDIASDAVRALLESRDRADIAPYQTSRVVPVESIPRTGSVNGARWAEISGSRLKLIVNTGGCKTPSCKFCALPSYGRSQASGDLAETVRRALQQPGLTDLSLYNDGNLLNEREVSRDELSRACRAIRNYGIKKLAIETIPRFVTTNSIREIRLTSNVAHLSIAMGLQSIGNFFAVHALGRPDVDSLFDFAIDQIHEAGAEVRLYLLWGFGTHSIAYWQERLTASVSWAQARSVSRVTICPYRSTISAAYDSCDAASEHLLSRLVADMQNCSKTTVDVVGAGIESCASSVITKHNRVGAPANVVE